MQQSSTNHHPASILWQWYQDMGVDELTCNQSTNWFEVAPPPAASPQLRDIGHVAKERAGIATFTPPLQPTEIKKNPISDSLNTTISQARNLADKATSLDTLRATIEAFDGCSLKKTAKHTIFSDGNVNADIMVIGDAPGADEDRTGVAFSGMSGQLLDAMLASIGLHRADNAYITHCLFWRSLGSRGASSEEIAICRPFIEKHISLKAPKLILLCGSGPVKAILNNNESISRLRGKAFEHNNPYLQHPIPVRVLFAPTYLLNQPLHKRLAWQDLLSIKEYALNNDIKLSL